MGKKTVPIIVITIIILSATYIFALEAYDTMPNKIEKLLDKVAFDEVTYKEIGVEFSGIQYEMPQDRITLAHMNEEMDAMLAHNTDCSKLCQIPHSHLATTAINEENNILQVTSYDSDEDWEYTLTLKNQKDIHYNTYYCLEITGTDIPKLDTLRARGKAQLEDWNVDVSESIYFVGTIEGPISKEEEKSIAQKCFKNLSADETSYYEDDLSASTCAYYGYTPWIKEYVKENNHEKTNMQVSFKYNDELNQTEMIIAFPFYNLPF